MKDERLEHIVPEITQLKAGMYDQTPKILPEVSEGIFEGVVKESVADEGLQAAILFFGNILFNANLQLQDANSMELFSKRYKKKLELALNEGITKNILLGGTIFEEQQLTTGELYQKMAQYLSLCVRQHGTGTLTEHEKNVMSQGFIIISAKEHTDRLYVRPEEVPFLEDRLKYLPLLQANIDVLARVRKNFDTKLGLFSAGRLDSYFEGNILPESFSQKKHN